MFGMTVAKRQTFIIGPDGLIAKHYEKVDPEEHSRRFCLISKYWRIAAEAAAFTEGLRPGPSMQLLDRIV